MITSKQFVDSKYAANIQDKTKSSDIRQINDETLPIVSPIIPGFSKDSALGCSNSGFNASADHYSLIAANINNNRDDNYSEEDSMSCTNCTDYSEDDISSRELDQLTQIGKFLAGMRQQHRGTAGTEEQQNKCTGKTVGPSAVSDPGSWGRYNRGRRGSSSSSGILRESSLTDKREHEDKNRHSRRRNSDHEKDLGNNSDRRDNLPHKEERNCKNVRNDFISIKESVSKSSVQRVEFESREHLKETCSSHYQYILKRMVKRTDSEEEFGEDMNKRINSKDLRRGPRAASYDRQDCLRRQCCSNDLSDNNDVDNVTIRNIVKEAGIGSSLIRSTAVPAMSHNRRNEPYPNERTPPLHPRSYHKGSSSSHYSGQHGRNHESYHISRLPSRNIDPYITRLTTIEHKTHPTEEQLPRKHTHSREHQHSRDHDEPMEHSRNHEHKSSHSRNHDQAVSHLKHQDHSRGNSMELDCSHSKDHHRSHARNHDHQSTSSHIRDSRIQDPARGLPRDHANNHPKVVVHENLDTINSRLPKDRNTEKYLEDPHHQPVHHQSQESATELGYPDLCRFFYRELRKDHNDILSNKVSTMMIECWQKNSYLYSDLEEMYLINMQSNQDRELLVRELVSTIGGNREMLPKEISQYDLVNLTIDFFNFEPLIIEKLERINQEKANTEGYALADDNNRSRRGGKYEGLKPVTTCIESILLNSGLHKLQCIPVAGDITERFVIASFTWEKMLQYHSRGRDKFTKKCIPHVFMSKDDLPNGLTSESILDQLFDMIENWKIKLFDALSVDKIIDPPVKEQVMVKEEVEEKHDTPDLHRQKEVNKYNQVKKEEKSMEQRDLERKNIDDIKMKKCNDEDFKSRHNNNAQSSDIDLNKKPSYGKDKTSTFSNRIQEMNDKSPSIEILKDRNNKVRSSPSQSNIRSQGTEEGFKVENNDKSIKENCEDEVKSFVEDTKKDEKLTNDSLSLLNRVNKILDIAKTWEIAKKSVKDDNDESSKAGHNHLNDSSDDSDDESKSRKFKENHKTFTKLTGSRNKKENSNSALFTRSLEDGEIQHSDTEATTDDIDDIILDDSDAIKPTNRKILVLKKGEASIPLTVEMPEVKSTKRRYRSGRKGGSKSSSSSESKSRSRSKSKPRSYEIRNDITDDNNGNWNQRRSNSSKRKSRSYSRSASLTPKRARTYSPSSKLVDKQRGASRQSFVNEFGKIGHRSLSRPQSESRSRHGSGHRFRPRSGSRIRHRSHGRSGHRSNSRGRKRVSSRNKHRSSSRDHHKRPRGVSRNGHKRSHRSRSKGESRKRHRSRSRDDHKTKYYPNPYSNKPHHRSRSFSPNKQSRWLPICPCELTSSIDVNPMANVRVRVGVKAEFVYDENIGCQVRMTKWTGKDTYDNFNVRDLIIRPQIVTIDEHNCLEIEIHNPNKDRKIYLQKFDKIGCLQILSVPIERRAMDNEKHIERAVFGSNKWFRVTNVVMQRRGTLEKITIYPSKTMKLIASVFGPVRKHRGKEVLITRLPGNKEFYVNSQIVRICDNENVGFPVTNQSKSTLTIYKSGQDVATLCVWAKVRL